MDFLEPEGLIASDDDRYPILRLTQNATDVLFGRKSISMRLAEEKGVPSYVVFSDAALKYVPLAPHHRRGIFASQRRR